MCCAARAPCGASLPVSPMTPMRIERLGHLGDGIAPGPVYAPRALPDGDCLCLAVLDAPLRFTGWKFRWINPFLRLHAH